jgi:hypothetical protein
VTLVRLSDFYALEDYLGGCLVLFLAAFLATRWARSSYQAGLAAGLRFVANEDQVDVLAKKG